MKRLTARFHPLLAWPLGILLGVYLLGVWISLPWFTFHDVRDNGFIAWIAGGELRTFARTLSWPVPVIHGIFTEPGVEDEIDFMLGGDPRPLPSALPFKPVRYSRLLSCLREKKTIYLSYRTDSGKLVVIQGTLKSGEGLVIERDTSCRAEQSGGKGSGSCQSPGTLGEVFVRMTDRDQDAALDAVEIKTRNRGEKRFGPLRAGNPADEQWTSFWESTLKNLYNSSECFVVGPSGSGV